MDTCGARKTKLPMTPLTRAYGNLVSEKNFPKNNLPFAFCSNLSRPKEKKDGIATNRTSEWMEKGKFRYIPLKNYEVTQHVSEIMIIYESNFVIF